MLAKCNAACLCAWLLTAADDVITLMRWVLDCIQSWFSETQGPWIVGPVAEVAVQDCQNFCATCMHVVSAVTAMSRVIHLFVRPSLLRCKNKTYNLFAVKLEMHMQLEISFLSCV